MTTDLLSSAFASFLDQRRAVSAPITDQGDQYNRWYQGNQDAYHVGSTSSLGQFTEPSTFDSSFTSDNPLLSFNNNLPPMKRLRVSSKMDVNSITTTDDINNSRKPIINNSSSDSLLFQQSVLPPLNNNPVTDELIQKTLCSTSQPRTEIISNDHSKQSNCQLQPNVQISSAENNLINKQKTSTSSIYLSHLSQHDLLIENNPKSSISTIRSDETELSLFTCNQCFKRFSSKEELKVHKKGHVRPFACSVQGCSASFSKANHLSRHIRIVHNKERPFACTVPGCGSRFGSKSHLGDHTKAVHMRLRTFKCNICNASWSKRFNLQKHIRIRHLGEKPYRCTICNMSFGTLSHVTRHEATVHKKDNA